MNTRQSHGHPSLKATPRTRKVKNSFAKIHEAYKGEIHISHMEVEDLDYCEHLHWD